MFRFSGLVACSGQETFGSDVRQTRRITWIAVAVARAAGSASPGAWRCVLVAGSFPSDTAVCQDRMVPPPRVCADPEDVDVGQRFDHLGVAVRAVLDRPLARIQHFGGGYLFTALIAVPHTLTFPEVLSQTGLLGAGPQTAAYLYIAAH